MTHPSFNTPHLSEMRRVLEEVPLSSHDDLEINGALNKIEGHWKDSHAEAYKLAVQARDVIHDSVIKAVAKFEKNTAEVKEQVEGGRLSPDAARAWLRDAYADFQRLQDEHGGVVASDERLTEFEALTPDEYQCQQFARFPALQHSQPTLGHVLAQVSQRNDPWGGISDRQIAEDQDALVKELDRSRIKR